jgi:hypothetical protein
MWSPCSSSGHVASTRALFKLAFQGADIPCAVSCQWVLLLIALSYSRYPCHAAKLKLAKSVCWSRTKRPLAVSKLTGAVMPRDVRHAEPLRMQRLTQPTATTQPWRHDGAGTWDPLPVHPPSSTATQHAAPITRIATTTQIQQPTVTPATRRATRPRPCDDNHGHTVETVD